MMDIYTIANNATEVVRKYMREQARGLNVRNCDIDYGHTVFNDFKSIDAYVYPYGENALRAFIVLSDSYGDVLDIYDDTTQSILDGQYSEACVGAWVREFLVEYFADMWNSARGIIEERERVKRLAEIRDDVEFRAVMGD